MLKREPFLYKFPPYLKLISLIVIIIICMFVFNLIGLAIALPIWGSGAKNQSNINFLKYIQIINEIGLFIAPVLIFAYLADYDFKRYLKIGHSPKMFALFSAILLMFVSLPLIGWLNTLNQAMHLPTWLGGIEKWMREAQLSNDTISNTFLKDVTKRGFLVNILMIAVLPAIGEELLFRGALIKLFKYWFNNVHVAVVVSAVLFSAIHFQFFGFFPRLVLGVMLGYMFVYSRNLWVPIAAHFVNNAFAVVIVYLNTRNIIKVDPDNFGNTNNDTIAIILSLLFVIILLFALYRSRRKMYTHHHTKRKHTHEEAIEIEGIIDNEEPNVP